MNKPQEILLDTNGNIIKSFYVSKSPVYGVKMHSTLEEAKEFVKHEILPIIKYMFYDFKDMTYYGFTI